MDAFAYIDLAFLNNFTSGNPDKMKKYISMFLSMAPQSIGKIENGIATADWEEVRSTAHALKPQITYMGIKKGEPLVRSIEENAKEKNNLEQLPDLFSQFKNICEGACDELKRAASAM